MHYIVCIELNWHQGWWVRFKKQDLAIEGGAAMKGIIACPQYFIILGRVATPRSPSVPTMAPLGLATESCVVS